MKLIDFLNLYNFREGDPQDNLTSDTQIIRIYPNFILDSNMYFDFGVYDYGVNRCIDSVLQKELLETEVIEFRMNNELGIFMIKL